MKKFVVLLVFFFVSTVAAQEAKNEKALCFWGNFGAGISSLGSGSTAVGVNLQLSNLLLTLQNTNHFYSSSFVFAEETKDFSAYSFLVGISTIDNDFHASASVGLDVISGTKTSGGGLNLFSESNKRTEEIGPILGLALNSQFFWKIGKVVGIGVELYADLNKSESLNGASLTLFLGQLY